MQVISNLLNADSATSHIPHSQAPTDILALASASWSEGSNARGHQPSDRWRKDEAMRLLRDSTLCSLQCFDTDSRVIGHSEFSIHSSTPILIGSHQKHAADHVQGKPTDPKFMCRNSCLMRVAAAAVTSIPWHFYAIRWLNGVFNPIWSNSRKAENGWPL